MKLLIAFLFISIVSYSQQADTILDRGIYKSHFSYKLREPLYVEYILYKGGGNFKRKDTWKQDPRMPMVSIEYKESGFDKGHLANAEDFANDPINLEKTFRYDNCIPQTPNLNRGIWKVWEMQIRKESHIDSLLILTGGIWGKKPNKTFPVPEFCFKVVYNLKSKTITHTLLFTNEKEDSECTEITIGELEKKIGYKLELSY